ncbi:NAD(P)H-quinone oxidoreductase [Demequina gelatinilytica]|uniref:NAD(P)H-quinone oxidoreductase n=1 Tax=Demequina gelatinilytica TaxID=1638980 RepID=UPI0007808679|nr:NAD(P)H-quinone oxidoreductase [Demequina gelatinilytica]
MKACVITAPGGPESLSLADVPFEATRPDHAVMRITASGVNRADILQRQGRYPAPSGAPAWPGLEAAGTLLSAPASSPWSAGDRVCALLPGGGYAERAAVEPSLLLPVPVGVSDVEAASLVEAACTVLSNLDEADARPGETLLVHGGSGGVGTAAIQIAKARGMRVITTAGGPERASRCAALGADVALDHRADDWVQAVRDLGGADVIVDVVGAAYLDANLRSLRTGGRLVVIGMQKGARGEFDLGMLLAKRARVIGTTLRARPLAERSAIVARVREEVWPLVPDRVRPIVHATVPLDRAADAHRLLESGEVFGKVVLTIA